MARGPAVDPLTELLQAIEAGALAPVYYLCGEGYAVDRAVEALRRAVLGQAAGASFNLDVLEGSDAGAGAILAVAATLPMFGERRLVEVRDAHQLSADELNRLLPYLQDPSPSTVLLLRAEKADLRLKFFGELKKHGVVARFEPLKDRQAPAWVVAEARRTKVKLLPGAAEAIADSVGTDMAQLASALEQCSLFAGPGQPVSPEQVEELLARTRQRSIFDLTNAVGRGQRGEALRVLRRMLADREPGVRILAMLSRHLRQLWQARELSGRGQPRDSIASALGIHPFFVGDILEQARRFSRAALERTHQALFQADRGLKSSRLSEAMILERLVLSLCPADGDRGRGGART